MTRAVLLSGAAVVCLLAAAGTARAGDWFDGDTARRYPGAASAASRAFLGMHADRLGVRGVDLAVASSLEHAGLQTVRYRQTYAGLPVFGAGVAVRMLPGGEVRAAVVDVRRGFAVSPVPSLDAAGAKAVVSAAIGRPVGGESDAELGVLARAATGGALVWNIDVPFADGLHRHVVDAHAGLLLRAWNLARDAKGKVYDVNVSKGPVVVRDLENLTPSTPQTLTGRAGKIYRHISGDVEQSSASLQITDQAVLADSSGDFLIDPATSQPSWTDGFAEVNVYYHLERTNRYYRDTIGLGTQMDQPKWALFSVVNYGPPSKTPYDNAFFTPWTNSANGIFIGQGHKVDFAYDSDVYLHEYAHYVNHNAIGFSQGAIAMDDYGIATMPGAMDEGSSDYFSSTLNDDAVVGEVALGSQARDLATDPGRCPEALIGESHQDGELIGSASWSIRQAIGKQLADPLVWGALAMLPYSPSFGDFANGITQTASDMKKQGKLDDAQLGKIASALAERGLDDCSRFLEVKPAKPRKTYLLGLDILGQLYGASCNTLKKYGMELTSIFQFWYAPAPSDKLARLMVKHSSVSGGSLDWDIYLRRNKPVTFSTYQMDLQPDEFDTKVEHLTATSGEIAMTETSSPKFNPADKYHVVIFHRSCGTTLATVSATGEPAITPPDAGPDGQAPEAGGDGQGPDAAKDSALDAVAEGSTKDGGAKDGATVKRDAGDAAVALQASSAVDEGTLEGAGACGCRVPAGRTGAGFAAAGLLALGALARRWRTRFSRIGLQGSRASTCGSRAGPSPDRGMTRGCTG
jgi:hypothetical protein